MHWSKSSRAGFLFALLAAVPASASDRTAPVVYKKKYVMGTVFEIVAYDQSRARASTAIDAALEEIVRLDHVMSNYDPDSDLSRLNRSAQFRAEVVPHDLYKVIEQSLRYSKLSDGAFDVTVGPLVNAWKVAMRGGQPPSPSEEDKLETCVGYDKVELILPDRIEFLSQCTEVDLGAIGKGYAVDRAVTVLRSYGIQRALVSAGGSTIYGLGSPPGEAAWLVHLRDPSGRMDPLVMLDGNSVSTSEQTRPSLLGDSPYGHIIDPSDGKPLKSAFAVSVVAKTATASDALSTTMLLVGPEKGRVLVKKLPDVAVIWVAPTGESETASTGPQIMIQRSVGESQ